jgi:hypothetical protein
MEKLEFLPEGEFKKPAVSNEMRELLKAGFPGEAYQQHESKKYLTTLRAMYIVERLNDVFGIGRWNLQHSVVSHENGYVLMKGRLLIFDYDCYIPEQYGGHKTEGTGVTLDDGFKSAITAILSKSASYLEIGIDMFKGLIEPPGGNAGNQKNKPVEREIKPSEIESGWNGVIYKGGCIYLEDTRIKCTEKQLTALRSHSKFKNEKN